ncbi:MAG: twin-arginine translocation pathway signal, partial [Novosphingobium sp.]|nr:twin-arginine translocation pathway signal [Novosphingobium sp.]
MNRRQLLSSGLAAGAAVAFAPRVHAQAFSIPDQHRRILDVAQREMERVRSHLWRTDVVGVAD